MSDCVCRAGRCDACGAACKRCCRCHKSSRKRGRPLGSCLGSKEPGEIRPTTLWDSAVVARSAIASQLTTINDDRGSVESHSELSRLFSYHNWSLSLQRSLPPITARTSETAESVEEKYGRGWSTMVQSVQFAAVRAAEILFPSDPAAILRVVGSNLASCGSEKVDRKYNKALHSLADLITAARKNSTERRVAVAAMVKMFPKTDIDAVQGEGTFTMGGST